MMDIFSICRSSAADLHFLPALLYTKSNNVYSWPGSLRARGLVCGRRREHYLPAPQTGQ